MKFRNTTACSSLTICANPSASPMRLHRKTPNTPQSAESNSTAPTTNHSSNNNSPKSAGSNPAAPIANHSSKTATHTICGIEHHGTYRISATNNNSQSKNLRKSAPLSAAICEKPLRLSIHHQPPCPAKHNPPPASIPNKTFPKSNLSLPNLQNAITDFLLIPFTLKSFA